MKTNALRVRYMTSFAYFCKHEKSFPLQLSSVFTIKRSNLVHKPLGSAWKRQMKPRNCHGTDERMNYQKLLKYSSAFSIQMTSDKADCKDDIANLTNLSNSFLPTKAAIWFIFALRQSPFLFSSPHKTML